jgi:hypothetical protein
MLGRDGGGVPCHAKVGGVVPRCRHVPVRRLAPGVRQQWLLGACCAASFW